MVGINAFRRLERRKEIDLYANTDHATNALQQKMLLSATIGLAFEAWNLVAKLSRSLKRGINLARLGHCD
jgi:hypothetical protein